MTTNTAVILLAGTGSRLKPLTDNTHKALIHIGEKAILSRQIETLHQSGVNHFHLVLGHRSKDIINFVETNLPRHLNFSFHIADNYLTTNNACSLYSALPHLNDGFILMDGDVVLDINLLHDLQSTKEHSSIIVDDDLAKLDAEAMKVTLNADGHVATFGKAVAVSNSAGEAIGVTRFSKAWTEHLKSSFAQTLASAANHHLYYEDIMAYSLQTNIHPEPLGIVRTGARKWVEVDDHKDLQRAQEMFANVF